MNKKTRKVFSILAIVVVVLLVVALIAFISTTLVRASKKANFYLVNDGVQIREPRIISVDKYEDCAKICHSKGN